MAKGTKLRKEIQRGLMKQLERMGSTGKHFADLVEDYMRLYDIKTGLLEDIKTRGEKVTVISASGVENIKTNDSVADLLKVNGQMLKIVDALGLDPAAEADFDDEQL